MDAIFIAIQGFVQYSIEFSDKSAVNPALQELLRCVNAFRNQAGRLFISEKNQQTPIHTIPSNLKTLSDVNKWMFEAHTPDPKQALATIAADDTRIVVNAIHSCGDGTWVARLLEHICHPENYGQRPTAPLPHSIYHTWKRDYDKLQLNETMSCASNTKISRVTPRLPPPTDTPSFKIHYVREPLTNLSCYNPVTNRCHKLSESLWTSLGLSNAAYIGKLMPFGQTTVFDLRRVFAGAGVEAQNYVASLPVWANATRDKTIAQLGLEMRRQFEDLVRNKQFLLYMKETDDAVFRNKSADPAPGLGIEMSSIGEINIQYPVNDIHFTMHVLGNFPMNCVSFLSYTTSHKERKTKEFVGQLHYTTMDLHPEDARVLCEGVRYALKNFSAKKNVGAAFDELVELQRSIY